MKRGLTYYLEHPEQVTELSEAEINALVDQYPYAQSLKWLKARYDLDLGLPSMRESVLAAAAATDDLVFLRYQLLHDSSKVSQLKSDLQKEETKTHDEVLSGVDLDEPVLTDVPISVNEEIEAEHTASVELDQKAEKEHKDSVSQKDEVGPSEELVASEAISEDETTITQKDVDEVVSGNVEISEEANAIEEEPADKLVRPTAEMKARQVDDLLNEYSNDISGFSKWLLAQEKMENVLSEGSSEAKKKSSKKKKKRKKKSKLEKLIDHSIVEREGVISETYANLLATQGYTQKAIELYQRLMLKFPEKSGYFAAKIEELQK